MWVKKISDSAKLIPYRIIWRWVPSPQSNISVSPSRITAMDETLRSTVGRDAEVPRKRRVSDMRAKYILALQWSGNAVCHSLLHQNTASERARWQPELQGKRRARGTRSRVGRASSAEYRRTPNR